VDSESGSAAPENAAPRFAATVRPVPSNSGRVTWVTRRPAAAAVSKLVGRGCHSAGSGSSPHLMWLRMPPSGLRSVKPRTPCAPGSAPVPRVTRLTGVVEGKPAVRARAGSSPRTGAWAAATGIWYVPSPSTSSTAIRSTPSSAAPSPSTSVVPGTPSTAQTLGIRSARLALPYAGRTGAKASGGS
jgi:hypothetical protein